MSDLIWHFRSLRKAFDLHSTDGGLSTSTLCGTPIVLLNSTTRRFLTANPDNIEFDRKDNCQKCALLLNVAKVNGFNPKGPDIEDQLESMMGRIRV